MYSSDIKVDSIYLDPTDSPASEQIPAWVHESLPRLTRELPIPRSCWAFQEPESFRPPRHHRSFYLHRANQLGVVAVKGSEPLAGDFSELLERVSAEISVSHASEPRRAAEHFASIERKVPCAVSIDEARSEADKALEIHRRHFAVYGSLAHIPYPLAVLRHSTDTEQRVAADISTRISPTAMEQLEPTLRNGLGVLIAYYPGMPTRATVLNYVLSAATFHGREEQLRRILDPEQLVTAWTRVLARLLHLQFVPTTPASGRTGNLCQPQNAALDGGFFDVDSVIPISGLGSPAAVMDALYSTTRSFYHTVRTLLVGRSYYHLDTHEDILDDWISEFVRTRLRTALVEEARPGTSLDPTVQSFFEDEIGFAGLIDRLRTYHPAQALQRSRDEARTFLSEHPWLLDRQPPS